MLDKVKVLYDEMRKRYKSRSEQMAKGGYRYEFVKIKESDGVFVYVRREHPSVVPEEYVRHACDESWEIFRMGSSIPHPDPVK